MRVIRAQQLRKDASMMSGRVRRVVMMRGARCLSVDMRRAILCYAICCRCLMTPLRYRRYFDAARC